MKGELQIEVARPPDAVFDFLTDIRNERSWNPRIITIEKATDGPIAAGTTFRGTYAGLGDLTTELLDVDRPRRFTFRSTGPRMRLTGQFTLTPTPVGTVIHLAADLTPQSVFRLFAPLMEPVIRKQNAAAAKRLQHVLDGPASSGAS